jgi:hypothetical protein
MFKTENGSVKDHFHAIVSTVVWAAFLVVGAMGALHLRGDITLTSQAAKVIGDGLAVFVLFVLLSIVYKANFSKKSPVTVPASAEPVVLKTTKRKK